MALNLPKLLRFPGSFINLQRKCSNSAVQTSRPDKLFEKISVEIRAHQPDVLKSYSWFATTSAKELNISVLDSFAEPQPHKVRKTLLRSAFVKKKHRVQYEFRWSFADIIIFSIQLSSLFSLFQNLLPYDAIWKIDWKHCPYISRIHTGKDIKSMIAKHR